MKIELSDSEIQTIVKKSIESKIEDNIEDIINDAIQDKKLQNVVKEILIDFVRSPEGRELLKKSFIEQYIREGDWIDSDNVIEAVDTEVGNLVKSLMKNVKFDFNGITE